MLRPSLIPLVACLLLSLGFGAPRACGELPKFGDPEFACVAMKQDAAGKYADSAFMAWGTWETDGDDASRDEKLARAAEMLARAFDTAEFNSAVRGVDCVEQTVEAGELEAGISAAVQEVAVLGLPDSRLGQRVTAVIVPRAGLSVSEEDLRAFLKDKISSYETPKCVELVDELPKSMIGKVLKAELRRRYTSP